MTHLKASHESDGTVTFVRKLAQMPHDTFTCLCKKCEHPHCE